MEMFAAVEGFTQIITYIMIVSGVPPCIHMLKTRETRTVPYPFFLTNFANSVMGFGYGILIENRTFVQINTVAASFNGLYILSYVYASKSKTEPLVKLSACVVVLGACYVYLTRLVPQNYVMDSFGTLLLTFSSAMLLTPMLQVKTCFDDKSAAGLSMSMLFAGFLCCLSWLAYGMLLNDVYIYAPNMIGVFSYVCQVGAVLTYGRRAKPRDHTEKRD